MVGPLIKWVQQTDQWYLEVDCPTSMDDKFTGVMLKSAYLFSRSRAEKRKTRRREVEWRSQWGKTNDDGPSSLYVAACWSGVGYPLSLASQLVAVKAFSELWLWVPVWPRWIPIHSDSSPTCVRMGPSLWALLLLTSNVSHPPVLSGSGHCTLENNIRTIEQLYSKTWYVNMFLLVYIQNI